MLLKSWKVSVPDERPPVHPARRAFREWRRQRPFTAGIFLVFASVVIGLPPYASFRLRDLVLSLRTIGGMSALLIAALLLICTASLWIRPQYRLAAGVTAIVVSLVALVSSNLGGFLVGTTLGLVGGALAISSTLPSPEATNDPDHGDGERDAGPPPSRFRSTGTAIILIGTLAATPWTSPSAEGAPGIAAAGKPVPHGPPASRVWVLKASVLRLTGLQYLGVGTTQVGDATVAVLRFTARRVDMTGLTQISEMVDGHTSTITAPPGSVSTATGTPIELLTVRLTGTLSLLGLIGIPVGFTPAHPPPLVLPDITFTDVTVVNTDLAHARLTIPDAKITTT